MLFICYHGLMSEKVPKPRLEMIPPESETLNQPSLNIPVEQITSAENQLVIEQMLAIANGQQGNKKRRTLVGLAAPQVGINKRIILVDVTSTGMGEKPTLKVYVNPVIAFSSPEYEPWREGCYSTGSVCGIVQRAKKVTIKAYDQNGKQIVEDHVGFAARVIQHEIDHLDGIRFPDRILNDKNLHWVEPDQFGEYREHWQDWEALCKRETWLGIKAGSHLSAS